uniref:Uncharacterized protein n=1 Tax=Romanomermis culicivorax TaxID=13658 RepID=A0A915IZ95_ROMCU
QKKSKTLILVGNGHIKKAIKSVLIEPGPRNRGLGLGRNAEHRRAEALRKEFLSRDSSKHT